MKRATLDRWRKEGRRFTEAEALRIAFDVAWQLDCGTLEARHAEPRLDTIEWDAQRRRAELEQEGHGCPGVRADARALGLCLVELLGGDPADPAAPEKLGLSRPARAAFDTLLKSPPSTPQRLTIALADRVGGLMPISLLWRRLRLTTVALAAVAVAAFAVHRALTDPELILMVKGSASSMEFSADGRELRLIVDGETLHTWDTESWSRRSEPKKAPHWPSIQRPVSSPDGALRAVLSSGREVVRIEDRQGRSQTALNLDLHDLNYTYLGFTPGGFSPDGRLFAAPYTIGVPARRHVRLWETSGWKLLRQHRLRSRAINPVVREIKLSRRWLAVSFGNDHTTEIHLWRADP
ncbi:MAG: WD40 repeat domain-containing protein [Elusimicrobia bacterium]|nr:WD40 repeat domain-containing protein [Elusimicrobiota bacterium]